jgi:regulator of protease activity HflC (stomatin/prohibitin superfamily)
VVIIAFVIAILTSGILVLLLVRRASRTFVLILAGVAFLSWSFAALGWISSRWAFSLNISLPDLTFPLFALFLSAFLILLGKLMGKKGMQTVAILLAAIWFAIGIGWLADAWSGILAVTVPSLMILFVGLMALPPFVLPVPPVAFMVPTWIVDLVYPHTPVLYKPRWKIPIILTLLFLLLWLVDLGAAQESAVVVYGLALLQALLVILRPAISIERAKPNLTLSLLIGYEAVVLLVVVFLGWVDPGRISHLLVLVQGILVLSAFFPSFARASTSVVIGLLLPYLVTCTLVGVAGDIPVDVANLALFLLGLVSLFHLLLPGAGAKERWILRISGASAGRPDARPDLLLARLLILAIQSIAGGLAFTLLLLYVLAWSSGWAGGNLSVTWTSVLTLGGTGLMAILLPLLLKRHSAQPRKDSEPDRPEPVYIARWKISTGIATLYNLLWLGLFWTGRLDMDILVLWVFFQGLLLIFRPSFPLQAVWKFVPLLFLVSNGFLAVSAWRLFQAFELTTFNVLIITQGMLALLSYTIPVKGKSRRWVLPLMGLYGLSFGIALMFGRIPINAASLFTLLFGLFGFAYLALRTEEAKTSWLERLESGIAPAAKSVSNLNIRWGMALLAVPLGSIYSLAFVFSQDLRQFNSLWFDLMTLVVGWSAIILPVFIDRSENWETFKALITYNFGTNYPYYAVVAGKPVKRAGGNPFAGFMAGPGIVLSDADHAVLINSGGGFSRVSPPGVNFTHGFETVGEVADLRPQMRTVNVDAHTRDGIEVSVEVLIQFRFALERALTLTPLGGTAILAGYDGDLRIWHLGTGEHLESAGRAAAMSEVEYQERTLPARGGWVRALAISAGDHRLFSISSTGTLGEWDLLTGRWVKEHNRQEFRQVVSLAVPNGQRKAVLAFSDGRLQVFDLDTGKPGRRLVEQQSGRTYILAAASNSSRVLAVNSDGTLRVWNPQNGEEVLRLAYGSDWINAAALTADGSRAVLASIEGHLTLLDLSSGDRQQIKIDGERHRGHSLDPADNKHDARAVTILPDGRRVVLVFSDGNLELWDTVEERALFTDAGTEAWREAMSDSGVKPGRSFPYDPEAIRKAVHAQRVSQERDEKQPWERLVIQACEQVIWEIFAGYELDDLLPLPTRERISGKIEEEVELRIRKNDFGLALTRASLGTITFPPEIQQTRMELWQADWENKIIALEVEAERQVHEIIDKARAEAQKELFLSITEGIDGLPTKNPERQNQLMVLYLLEAIEREGKRYPDLTWSASSPFRARFGAARRQPPAPDGSGEDE